VVQISIYGTATEEARAHGQHVIPELLPESTAHIELSSALYSDSRFVPHHEVSRLLVVCNAA